MGKAIIHLLVSFPFEVCDNGYLGDKNSSIQAHIDAAKKEVGRNEVYLKRNTDSEFRKVTNATMTVERVELIP